MISVACVFMHLWCVIGASEPPSSEFNGDFCLHNVTTQVPPGYELCLGAYGVRVRTPGYELCLGTSCVWMRTVSGYVRVMPASRTKRYRQLYSAVDNNSVREALRRGQREADRSRRAVDTPRTEQV